MPRGCGEQNMITMAPNVYIYKYLKSIDQVTVEIEVRATANIETGRTQWMFPLSKIIIVEGARPLLFVIFHKFIRISVLN